MNNNPKKENITTESWLPTSLKEVRARGWDTLDVILFSGDAYIDHPSFGIAVLGRILAGMGLRVAVVPQPNWRDDLRDFRKLGKPRLFFGVSAGAMDSMVNHYTANKRLRSDDAYTPGGRAGQRPDYPTIVYTRILKKLYPGTPVIIGGVEASMRRFTHYDYWQDKLLPSILIDSGANLLVYGMGEKAITDIARLMDRGVPVTNLVNIPQTAFVIKNEETYSVRADAGGKKVVANRAVASEIDNQSTVRSGIVTVADTSGLAGKSGANDSKNHTAPANSTDAGQDGRSIEGRVADDYNKGQSGESGGVNDGNVGKSFDGGTAADESKGQSGAEGKSASDGSANQSDTEGKTGADGSANQSGAEGKSASDGSANQSDTEGKTGADESKGQSGAGVVRLYSHEECLADKKKYAINFRIIEEESNKLEASAIVQNNGNVSVIVNPPYPPPDEKELDRIYDMPFTRLPHPRYRNKGTIPAYEMIRHSITMHRGCFGGCSFCTISAHQGKFVSSRSEKSVLLEVEKVRDMPDFKGYISDLGGPSANMYKMQGKDKKVCRKCRKPSCIFPTICSNLETSPAPLLRIYRKARSMPGIKKAFVGSGIRYDLFLDKMDQESYRDYARELIKHHVSGRLKVAPEHSDDKVLKMMRKPSFSLYKKMQKLFDKINREEGLNQQLIPYFISSHPGCGNTEMAELALITKNMNFRPEQIQDFTPTPMTLATVIYHTGINPYTMEKVRVARTRQEKLAQQQFFFWYKKEYRASIRAELLKMGRQDLVDKLLGRKK